MRILQVCYSYAPNWGDGGPSRVMYDYAVQLIKLGHTVSVLAPENNRPTKDSNWDGFSSGISIHYLKKYNDWRKSFYFDYSYRELEEYFKLHHKEIDIIHLPQTRTLLNVVAYKAAEKYGIPVALSSFGSLPRRSGLIKLIYDSLFVIPMVKQARILFGQTKNECSVYSGFGANANYIKLLPLAVDLNTVPEKNEESAMNFRQNNNIPSDAILFLFLGRLNPTKGVKFLLESYIKINTHNKKVYLAIVGHDEGILSQIEEIIKTSNIEDRVCICGPLYDHDRWQAYNAADCYVITPEIYEETSLASLEALSCGTPVITTGRSDIPWLEEYNAGQVIEEGNQEALIKAMSDFVNLPIEERVKTGRNAERLIKEKFAVSSVASQLESYFLEAL
ncbi:glycosyltransferase [Aliikangiella sp. IMCC44359]|uniref:glycosyltransferase n=1 Tax=Aliikangiella sp. IMCC44359 TaxID=3459125 RepID=UPI00403B0B1D